MYERFACLSVCATHMCLMPKGSGEGVRAFGTGVRGGYEPICESWELNPGPLQEQYPNCWATSPALLNFIFQSILLSQQSWAETTERTLYSSTIQRIPLQTKSHSRVWPYWLPTLTSTNFCESHPLSFLESWKLLSRILGEGKHLKVHSLWVSIKSMCAVSSHS